MTDFTGDRRRFLRLALGKAMDRVAQATEDRIVQQRYVRPPGAMPEIAFLAACTRCGLCVPACPAGAIRYLGSEAGLAAGTPRLEPERIPCVACTDMPCAAACPTEALVVPATGWAGVRIGRVTFHPQRCITFEGEACGACAEACPVGDAALIMDGDGHPVLKVEGCVGCGVCVRECPTSPSSFSFSPLER